MTLTLTCSFGVGVRVYSLISSPFPYISVCLCALLKKKKEKKKEKRKRYWVLSSRSTSVICDIEKGFITSSTTLTIACSFGVVLWVYTLISTPFPYIICFCVCLTKKKRKERYSVLLSRPTLVICDIEKGFFTCYATLCAAWSFVVSVWVYYLVSSPFPYMCVCLTKKLKKRYSVLSSHPTLVRWDIDKELLVASWH